MGQGGDYLCAQYCMSLSASINYDSELTSSQLDYLPLSWAIHRLSGVVSPASSTYTASELTHQVKSSGSRAIFTVNSLLQIALKAASSCSIPRKHVYLLEMSIERQFGYAYPRDIKTAEQLVLEGSRLPDLEGLRWEKGQGARQCAFLSYSSGTTGLPVCLCRCILGRPMILAADRNLRKELWSPTRML